MLKRFLTGLAALLLLATGWLIYAYHDRPDLADYDALLLPEAPADAPLRVTFLGVSTLLISDGETALLTDGFFSRPGLLATATKPIAPDVAVIERSLAEAGIERLAAVIVVHSHYDHVMDAPEVARRTGAMLVGSASTANVGRGWGLPEQQLVTVDERQTLDYGAFRVTLVKSRHFPHGQAMGEIRSPLVPPVRAEAYLEGGSYSVFIEHRGKRLLIQGSAGFIEGALADERADTVFLGVGLLGSKDSAYQHAYWRETVTQVGATRVIPIHWDDFFSPLQQPLQPFPRLLDNLDATMAFLQAQSREQGVALGMPTQGRAIDPFSHTNGDAAAR